MNLQAASNGLPASIKSLVTRRRQHSAHGAESAHTWVAKMARDTGHPFIVFIKIGYRHLRERVGGGSDIIPRVCLSSSDHIPERVLHRWRGGSISPANDTSGNDSRQDCPSAACNLKSGRKVRAWGTYEDRGGVRSKPFENPSIAVERWSRAEKKPTIHAIEAS